MHCGLAAEAREVDDEEGGDVVPVRGLGRRFSALRGPLEGWWVASKGLAALHRKKGSTLAHGCGREGSGALPLPRAAAVSTRLRVRPERGAISISISISICISLCIRAAAAAREEQALDERVRAGG